MVTGCVGSAICRGRFRVRAPRWAFVGGGVVGARRERVVKSTDTPLDRRHSERAFAVLACLALGCASLPTSSRRSDAATGDAGLPAQDAALLDAPSLDAGTGTCPAGMAYIPAGSFLMGDADTESRNAQPPHMVSLSAYCMDLTEVTVAAYRGCKSCTAPTAGTTDNAGNWGVTGRDSHPVNLVDWNQARAYCQWRAGDLPTEAQWEYAARGSDVAIHIYPWGYEEPLSQLCWSGVTNRSTTCPVQAYPSGNSPFGLFDMAGNVWEWTRDFYGVRLPTLLAQTS